MGHTFQTKENCLYEILGPGFIILVAIVLGKVSGVNSGKPALFLCFDASSMALSCSGSMDSWSESKPSPPGISCWSPVRVIPNDYQTWPKQLGFDTCNKKQIYITKTESPGEPCGEAFGTFTDTRCGVALGRFWPPWDSAGSAAAGACWSGPKALDWRHSGA